uniref:Septin-type G domain-containing protein n=1 Tax=Trichuris muris TaxID=70415 RepID=A0A5S6Q7X8_TRIMR
MTRGVGPPTASVRARSRLPTFHRRLYFSAVSSTRPVMAVGGGGVNFVARFCKSCATGIFETFKLPMQTFPKKINSSECCLNAYLIFERIVSGERRSARESVQRNFKALFGQSPTEQMGTVEFLNMKRTNCEGELTPYNYPGDCVVKKNLSAAAPKEERGAIGTHELRGFVGFSYLPNQVHGNALKKGFEFTIIVVGQSGLGKSTLMNSLFMADIYDVEHRCKPERLTVEENVVQLVENGVRLVLTLVDTPGFGDSIDNNNSWLPIVEYIDRKYAEYFEAETKIDRLINIPDKRVHCCLYFIAPNSGGLRPLDIKVLKALHDRVNVIPVIAKADTLLPDECRRMKAEVMKQIADNEIQVYDFPEPEDQKITEDQMFKERLPFAVVGSSEFCESRGGKKVRGRKYPWGLVEVENLEHNDFLLLKNSLIRTYMLDLVDITNHVHYENFRCRQMLSSGDRGTSELSKDPFTQIEEERLMLEQKLKQDQLDFNQVFQQKVQEKLETLKAMEEEMSLLMLRFEKEKHDKMTLIDERSKQLADEKAQFQEEHPGFARNTSADSLKDKKKRHLLFA